MKSTFDVVQNDKSTPLHLACTQGATEVVKLMLSSFQQVEDVINLTDGACQTPLHRWATLVCHLTICVYMNQAVVYSWSLFELFSFPLGI